jgi:hypothetical protein
MDVRQFWQPTHNALANMPRLAEQKLAVQQNNALMNLRQRGMDMDQQRLDMLGRQNALENQQQQSQLEQMAAFRNAAATLENTPEGHAELQRQFPMLYKQAGLSSMLPEQPKPLTGNYVDDEGNYNVYSADPGSGEVRQLALGRSRKPTPTTSVHVGNEGPQFGTIPQGYQLVKADDGSYRMDPVQGGPADAEIKATQQKKLMAARDAARKSKVVTRNIDKAIKGTGIFTAGFIGNLISSVPGSPAYDLGQTIDTIKANIGFDTLQAMRDASPTGGALGQVSERELAQLERVLGSLDQAQTPKQLAENLRLIRKHYNNWKAAVMKASPSDFAERATEEDPAYSRTQAEYQDQETSSGKIKFLGFE